MSILDNVGGMLSRGVDSVGRTGKTVGLRAQLSEISRQQKLAFEQLGIELYAKTYNNPEMRAGCEALYAQIAELSEKTAALQEEITRLEGAGDVVGAKTTYDCPHCKKKVAFDYAMCPFCGKSLEHIRSTMLQCPTCSSLASKGDSFCIECGGDLSQVKSEPAAPATSAVPATPSEPIPVPAPPAAPTTAATAKRFCGDCGTACSADDTFCEGCGSNLKEQD